MNLSLSRDDLLPGRNLIGQWREAQDGGRPQVSDPATDTVFASVPDSGAADAKAAAHAAHAGPAPCRPSSGRRS
jgi:succinate-semialdehyde dehydrogenase/glutarate-semialdehyde dehydrogenase